LPRRNLNREREDVFVHRFSKTRSKAAACVLSYKDPSFICRSALFPKLKMKLMSDIQRYSIVLRKITSMVLMTHGKSYGITVYVRKFEGDGSQS
jgi:hypothetical protein